MISVLLTCLMFAVHLPFYTRIVLHKKKETHLYKVKHFVECKYSKYTSMMKNRKKYYSINYFISDLY